LELIEISLILKPINVLVSYESTVSTSSFIKRYCVRLYVTINTSWHKKTTKFSYSSHCYCGERYSLFAYTTNCIQNSPHTEASCCPPDPKIPRLSFNPKTFFHVDKR